MRAVVAFLAGFIAGMLFLIGLLWRSGSLQPVRAAVPVVAPQPAQQTAVPDLLVPVSGANVSHILDTFDDARGAGARHEAVDIMAPRGTPVLAADDGKIVKLFNSRRGGTTIYQFDPSQSWCYYYGHLDRYAAGIAEGAVVQRGQIIAYVGSTGDASAAAPHLHFAIFKLGPEKHWWQGTPVNPYPILMRHARQ